MSPKSIKIMKPKEKFSFKKRIKSFKFAFNGLWLLIRDEHNARIHFVIAILTITAGFYFSISAIEWLILILTIGFVFVTEFFNSAIEALADNISEEEDPNIKKSKDLAAGGVLFAAIISVIVGLIIFGPRFLELI